MKGVSMRFTRCLPFLLVLIVLANLWSKDRLPKPYYNFFRAPNVSEQTRAYIKGFKNVETPWGVKISPRGNLVCYNWDKTGNTQVWCTSWPHQNHQQLNVGSVGKSRKSVTFKDFSPDGTIFIVSVDGNGAENPGMYAVAANGLKAELVKHVPGAQAIFQGFSEDSRHVFYKINDPRRDSHVIYRYEFSSKNHELVFGEEGLWDVDDIKGSRLLLRKSTGEMLAEYYLYDVSSHTKTPLLGQNEKEFYRLAFAASDDEYLMLTDKFGDNRMLYRWRKGSSPIPISKKKPLDVTSFSINPARTRILYQVSENWYKSVYGLNARDYAPLAMPVYQERQIDHVYVISNADRYTSFSVEPANALRLKTIYDWQTETFQALTVFTETHADVGRFVQAKLEFYPAQDGTQIPMFVRRPPECVEVHNPCPVVVYFHGGPDLEAEPGINIIAEILVKKGFIVLQPNMRGSTGRGKAWLAADNGLNRENVIRDIEDVGKFIRSRWVVNGIAPKIGVMGGSYGGYCAMLAMTMFAGTYDAGVSEAGMSDLKTFFENTAPRRKVLRRYEYGDIEDQKVREMWWRISPMSYVDRLEGSLMIIHGLNDERVKVSEANQIYWSARIRRKNIRMIIFTDQGHVTDGSENFIVKWGNVLEFFERNLKK
jgi:dipeptidyl aminopeptidase/acylaminoacyl peptidase